MRILFPVFTYSHGNPSYLLNGTGNNSDSNRSAISSFEFELFKTICIYSTRTALSDPEKRSSLLVLYVFNLFFFLDD